MTALTALTGTWLVTADSTCDVETRYYCASVVADPERDGGRTLVLDGLRHSYVDLDDPTHLEFAYTQRIADVLAEQPDGPLDVLHLGGGGFTVPRHLAAVRPGSRSTVLEVDPQIPEIGRRVARPGHRRRPARSRSATPARSSPSRTTAAYDVVVGDAFGSLAVPWHLTTTEMVEQVRRVLRPGGVYVLNVIDRPPLSLRAGRGGHAARRLRRRGAPGAARGARRRRRRQPRAGGLRRAAARRRARRAGGAGRRARGRRSAARRSSASPATRRCSPTTTRPSTSC